MTLSRQAIDFIRGFEGLDQPSRWPGEDSGVTLGRGYDLGFSPEAEFRRDWGPHLTEDEIDRLAEAIGVKGEAAAALCPRFEDITITEAMADAVFEGATMPKWEAITQATYPGVQQLPPLAYGAIVSLVFNRGPSLKDRPRRREMRALVPLVRKGDLNGIAYQIRSMKRLWPDARGLRARREAEAKMVESCLGIQLRAA